MSTSIDRRFKIPPGFHSPTAQPQAPQETEWQEHNRSWWESNPMRYDWNRAIPGSEFSAEFFEEIDRRFFAEAEHYTPSRKRPFDELIPFEELKNSAVLEIGVGNGSHAQLIAPHCGKYVGIDLTAYAVESTRRRFEVFKIPGTVLQMDAEKMDFPDASFDFIWTWGVIHHSSNTEQILNEMRRVLRPGGRAVIMVYHRSFLYYYVFNGLFRGLLAGEFFKLGFSLHDLVQLRTDGALARFYKTEEWRAVVEKRLRVDDIRVMGQKAELVPLPNSRMKGAIIKTIPGRLCRLILNDLRQGSFLVSTVSKR